MFNKRDRLDLLYLYDFWFESLTEPKDYKLDTIRDYFGMSKLNAHDAKQDVIDCARILIKFYKLHRSIAPKVKFKGCCQDEI